MGEVPALLVGSATVGVGILLLQGGWWKARHRSAFKAVLLAQGRRSRVVLTSAPVVVPLLESVVGAGAVGVGLGIASDRWSLLVVAAAISCLSVVFLGYATWHLVRGDRVPCGCLDDTEAIRARSLVRPAFMAATGVLTMVVVPDLTAGTRFVEAVTRFGCGGLIAVMLGVGLHAVSG